MGFSCSGSPLSARLFRIPRKLLVLFACLALFCLSGCRVGPDYQRPVVAAPSEFRWKAPEPTTLPASSVCVSSWSVFNDAKLDELEKAALEGNQDIRLALARVDETRAQARLNKADFFPKSVLNPRSAVRSNPAVPSSPASPASPARQESARSRASGNPLTISSSL